MALCDHIAKSLVRSEFSIELLRSYISSLQVKPPRDPKCLDITKDPERKGDVRAGDASKLLIIMSALAVLSMNRKREVEGTLKRGGEVRLKYR